MKNKNFMSIESLKLLKMYYQRKIQDYIEKKEISNEIISEYIGTVTALGLHVERISDYIEYFQDLRNEGLM